MKMSMQLNNHFLIAMPGMGDPFFEETVILICDHDQRGAIGVIVNRPLPENFIDVFKEFDLPFSSDLKKQPVVLGGPVHQERGFVLHSADHSWESSVDVSDNMAITISKDILYAIGEKNGPEKVMISLGCSGWESGQLEEELSDNVWLTCPADPAIVFDVPYGERWDAAMRCAGVDPLLLSSEVGHG